MVEGRDIDYKTNLKNRLYGLLCEREKDGEWESFLDNILIDLNNFRNEKKSFEYYYLYSKLSSCRFLTYKYYRRIIFECMNLIDKMDVI